LSTQSFVIILIFDENMETKNVKSTELATLAGGCFWCLEAIFQQLKGVTKVVSGYSNGDIEKPTYKQVCTGLTGYAEVVQIEFEPGVISFETLLDVFWNIHDPTTLNRQGNDVGTQYRSGIYVHNVDQQVRAEAAKATLEKSGLYNNAVVTEILPVQNFYSAEIYHQNYYSLNSNQPYCSAVIGPKLAKFKKLFSEKMI